MVGKLLTPDVSSKSFVDVPSGHKSTKDPAALSDHRAEDIDGN